MTRRRQLTLAGIAVAIVALLVWGFRARRGELAAEAASDAPIISPRRVRIVSGPIGDEAAIVLDPAVQTRLGIETRTLHADAANSTIQLVGQLAADPSRVTTIQAPIAGRLVAVGGAWPVFGQRIAAGSTLAQVSDARPLIAPQGGTVTRVAARPGELVQPGQVLLEITDVSELLARVVWRAEAPSTPPVTIRISPVAPGLGTPSAVQATLLGPAAEADSVTRMPVYLYRTSGAWVGARPGVGVIATLRDQRSSLRGFVVPTEAVVQWEGLSWVYVRHGSSAFVRERVDTRVAVEGGWLVDAGSGSAVSRLAGVDTIVVRGAQILLSEEFRARMSSEDKQ
ncbi:MAG TPA: HlyD family efflux transporter periplasmic adaptor subunit [Gemmatimonadaceae bacterium]